MDTPVLSAEEIYLAERCDKCPAVAYITVAFETGNLYFCGHHGKKYRQAWSESALEVDDPHQYLIV